MPVAVRLIEILALVTLLGILTGFSILVVVAQRLIFLLLLFITPLTYAMHGLLGISEKILFNTLSGLVSVTNKVSDNME